MQTLATARTVQTVLNNCFTKTTPKTLLQKLGNKTLIVSLNETRIYSTCDVTENLFKI
jgi:predicted transcriptional regulator